MLKITQSTLKQLAKYNLNLDMYFYMLILENPDVGRNYTPDENAIKAVDNLGYAKNGALTYEGLEMMRKLQSRKVEEVTPSKYEEQFEEFWSKFPKNDAFGTFPVNRKLRIEKEASKQIYSELLSKGYTHEQIMKGLETEIHFRSISSVDKNNFFYMRSTPVWLNKKTFLEFTDDDIHIKDNPNDVLLD